MLLIELQNRRGILQHASCFTNFFDAISKWTSKTLCLYLVCGISDFGASNLLFCPQLKGVDIFLDFIEWRVSNKRTYWEHHNNPEGSRKVDDPSRLC